MQNDLKTQATSLSTNQSFVRYFFEKQVLKAFLWKTRMLDDGMVQMQQAMLFQHSSRQVSFSQSQSLKIIVLGK